jgi:hypothetical protein
MDHRPAGYPTFYIHNHVLSNGYMYKPLCTTTLMTGV